MSKGSSALDAAAASAPLAAVSWVGGRVASGEGCAAEEEPCCLVLLLVLPPPSFGSRDGLEEAEE